MSRANTKQPSRVLVRPRCDVFPLTNGDRNGRLNRSFDPLSHKNTIQHTPLIFRRSSTSILPNKGLWQYALWLEMDSEYDKHYLWHYWEVVKGYRSIDAITSRDLKVCYVIVWWCITHQEVRGVTHIIIFLSVTDLQCAINSNIEKPTVYYS